MDPGAEALARRRRPGASAIARDGSTWIVADAHGAHVLVDSGTTFVEHADLTPSDATANSGPVAVAVHLPFILLGMPALASTGRVYAFFAGASDGGVTFWEAWRTDGPTGAGPTGFGTAVAVADGAVFLVGAPLAATVAEYVPNDDDGGMSWREAAPLLPAAAGDERFGTALALRSASCSSARPALRAAPAPSRESSLSRVRPSRPGRRSSIRRRRCAPPAPRSRSTTSSPSAPPRATTVPSRARASPWSRARTSPTRASTRPPCSFLRTESRPINSAPGKTLEEGVGQGEVFVFQNAAPLGTPCDGSAACASSFCVDGVCCDTACGHGALDDCEACSAALQSSAADGTCGVVRAGTACGVPADECIRGASCNGVDPTCPATRLADDGTPCSQGWCFAGMCSGSGGPPPDAGADAGTRGVDRGPGAGGCGCGPRGPESSCAGIAAALLALATIGARRRRGGRR